MSLYFQPTDIRTNDNSLPTAPTEGLDVSALIDELTNRVNQATRKLEYMIDRNSLAKIVLTDKDIVLAGDQVSIVGQLNIVDWVRNVSGNVSGGIDTSSLTRITGGKIQTGIIQSTNWSTSQGSQINLDTGTIVTGGSTAPKFSVNASGVMTCQNALVVGTLQAGSIIAGSVRLNNTSGPTLDSIAAGTDVQAALTAGVTNILAGIGSNFRLNVDAANGFIAVQHKDAVFLGNAAAGSVKPALGISASGIGIGYNRASDGAWVTSITLDASGNGAFLGTLTAGSIITNSVTVDGVTIGTIKTNAQTGATHSTSTGNVHNVALSQISGDLDDIANGTTYFKATASNIAGASRAYNALDGNSDYIRSLVSTKLTVVGSNPSTGWVGDTNGIRLYQSGVLKINLPVSGSPSFSGDIIGGSNIVITGNARFMGAHVYDTDSYAGTFNENLAATNGTFARGRQGVVARTTQSDGNCFNGIIDGSGAAVMGMVNSGTGMGVTGVSNTSSGYGVHAVNIGGGVALRVTGHMSITSSVLVSNLNAQYINGISQADLCSLIATNSGIATVTGSGFQLNSTVAGTRTRAAGGNLVVIESTSDERLKQDIEQEVLGLEFIDNLRPVTYRLKSDDSIKYHGFIGQELEYVMHGTSDDSLCRELSDGMISTDYVSLIAPIVKSIQEISQQLQEIKNRIEA